MTIWPFPKGRAIQSATNTFKHTLHVCTYTLETRWLAQKAPATITICTNTVTATVTGTSTEVGSETRRLETETETETETEAATARTSIATIISSTSSRNCLSCVFLFSTSVSNRDLVELACTTRMDRSVSE